MLDADVLVDECASCGEVPEGECAESQRPCGHHCNHSWSHDVCCWCHRVFDDEEVQMIDGAEIGTWHEQFDGSVSPE